MEDINQFIRDVAILILGGVSTFIVTHWKRPQEKKDEHSITQQRIIEGQSKTLADTGKTLSDAFNEIEDLRKAMHESDRRNRITWGYMIVLVEGYKEYGIIPPAPPKELETDPELMRLIKSIKEKSK